MSTQIPVWMGSCDGSVIIRPEGPCTFCICETIDAALRKLTAERIDKLYIDLSRAEWLDSTFTGYLVSLVTRHPHGRLPVRLLNPSEPAQNCLVQMHVLPVFQVESELNPAPARWEQLVPVEVSRDETGARLLDAHERLIETDARNEAAFAPVVKLFRREATSCSTPEPTDHMDR